MAILSTGIAMGGAVIAFRGADIAFPVTTIAMHDPSIALSVTDIASPEQRTMRLLIRILRVCLS